ncbi:hypothetical protein ACLOJK_040251 [Asimina triloba]
MKSVNYLPNVLSKMEAEENAAFAAIWLDSEGYVAEGPNMNVAFVTAEKELLMPNFDKILSGCTAKRVLALAERLVKEGTLSGIRVGNVTVEEGKRADEMMLIGSGVLVRPVLQWDELVIGNGTEGPVAKALLDLVVEDMKAGPSTNKDICRLPAVVSFSQLSIHPKDIFHGRMRMLHLGNCLLVVDGDLNFMEYRPYSLYEKG